MLTVSQVIESAQVPNLPDYIPLAPQLSPCVCPWCKSLLQHPPLPAIPSMPHVCLLHEPKRTHHILCTSCAQIIAILYYYQAGWDGPVAHKVFKGPRLAVYVELERLGATATHAVPCPVAQLARTIGYGYHATYQALRGLARAGYIQDTILSAPHRHVYSILVHQLPKGE